MELFTEGKSVIMAGDPCHAAQRSSRPVFAKLIAWGFILFLFYKCLGRAEGDKIDDYLLCRQCGHEIAKGSSLIKVPSPKAEFQRNDTILGIPNVLIQNFINPHGAQFEVITTRTADVYKEDQAFEEFSWFPGFLWRLVKCPRCGFHLGWAFLPIEKLSRDAQNEKSFIGLILSNLLHQDYADSLIMTPKFRNS